MRAPEFSLPPPAARPADCSNILVPPCHHQSKSAAFWRELFTSEFIARSKPRLYELLSTNGFSPKMSINRYRDAKSPVDPAGRARPQRSLRQNPTENRACNLQTPDHSRSNPS